MSKPIRIIIHHTADCSTDPQLTKVNNYHESRGFPISSLGYYVGYHYFIERNGDTIQCRQDTEEGAHTKGMNSDSLGICLTGDFNEERPTFAQLVSLKNLINSKMEEHNILPNNISGHRNFRQTSCPGNLFLDQEIKELFTPTMSYLQRIVDTLKEKIAQLTKNRLGRITERDNEFI